MLLRVLLLGLLCAGFRARMQAELTVGTSVVDVTPPQFPVLVNGGMFSQSVDSVQTKVTARAIVADDGTERIAIVVVDSCMMPRELIDQAKSLATKRTQIAHDRIMISATHTHSAPSCMGALGTPADPAYVSFLREKIAETIQDAESNLEPAEIGFSVGNADQFNSIRRWIRRTDRIAEDPFGNRTVRANMHAARNWDNVTGPSGPEDPDLSLIAFRSLEGEPLAVLANFSMHYFGAQPISADYFGLFCGEMQERLNQSEGSVPATDPVVIMSHGCSGDIWRRDYWQTNEQQPNTTVEEFSSGLVDVAMKAHASITYSTGVPLVMSEKRLPMKYRVPDKQRLAWAEAIVDDLQGELPKTQPQVYAREQVLLHGLQETTVVVQAIRFGHIAIATTPNETYAITGLKIKTQSPLQQTMVIELANGGDGYIPPPEQHFLGGYNTWAARSAGLEVTAEPRITEACLDLLERVSELPRRVYEPAVPPSSQTTLRRAPLAYYRLHEFGGRRAIDAAGQSDGIFEPGVAFFLPGPVDGSPKNHGERNNDGKQDINRCVHFAGGRLGTRLAKLGENYRIEMWFWNGMPNEAREVGGWLFSRDRADGLSSRGDHLGIGGTDTSCGKLLYQFGDNEPVVGKTNIERWTWHKVAFDRNTNRIQVFLDDSKEPEISVQVTGGFSTDQQQIFFAGRSDNQFNFEGRIDEIAVFAN